MLTREDVVREARSWLGVRWRHQGRSRAGVDCGGLVVMVGRALGLLPVEADMKGYPVYPDGRTLDDVCRRYLVPKIGEALPGDVPLMRPAMSVPWPCHLGIVTELETGELGLIHSYGNTVIEGAVKETRYTRAGWKRRTTVVFAYRGVE